MGISQLDVGPALSRARLCCAFTRRVLAADTIAINLNCHLKAAN